MSHTCEFCHTYLSLSRSLPLSLSTATQTHACIYMYIPLPCCLSQKGDFASPRRERLFDPSLCLSFKRLFQEALSRAYVREAKRGMQERLREGFPSMHTCERAIPLFASLARETRERQRAGDFASLERERCACVAKLFAFPSMYTCERDRSLPLLQERQVTLPLQRALQATPLFARVSLAREAAIPLFASLARETRERQRAGDFVRHDSHDMSHVSRVRHDSFMCAT